MQMLQLILIATLWRTAEAVFVGGKPANQTTHLRGDEGAATTPTVVQHEAQRTSFWGVPQQISTHLGGRQWWGFPHYEQDEAVARRNWEQFAIAHGHYGKTCTQQTRMDQCTAAFICKAGTCLECQVNRDCDEKSKCITSTITMGKGRKMCIPRDLATQWHWREVICTILIVITAMLSAAAGMGGGGVYVPLLLLFLGFSTKEAVPLSQAMIVGGAVVNVLMFCGERHPKYPHRPRIDYDVIMMMNPGLAAGVTLGVMCHLISPQWLIVSTLLITLAITLQKSASKGFAAWHKESAVLAAQAANGPRGGGGANNASLQIKLADFPAFKEFALDNTKPMLLILGCWAVFFLLNVVKAPQCSTVYWLQLLGMLLLCVVFTVAGSHVIRSRVALGESSEGLLTWTPTTMWLYPLMSVAAGFLGGFLGIGGGIIMGPLLLELGMTAEANQATTAMFVFLSSSLATIQFVVLGKTMPQFVAWFTSWVVVSTFIGQTGIDYMLRKYQRASLIILSIAGIVACSMVMMGFIGTWEVYSDIQRGADMNIKPHQLCTGH